jgi:hypothetical protein
LVAFYIAFLCAAVLRLAVFLGPFVMTLAIRESDRNHNRAVSNFGPRQEAAALTERVSDVWLDWPTEQAEAELRKAAEKNKLSVVLREAARATLISVGMVIALMVVLSVLQVR